MNRKTLLAGVLVLLWAVIFASWRLNYLPQIAARDGSNPFWGAFLLTLTTFMLILLFIDVFGGVEHDV